MALAVESPAHEVLLDPFLVSKYEFTQMQWQRWTGDNPSFWQPPRNGHQDGRPLESVTWNQCDRELRSWGLLLPTEAQWECAARGSRLEPWWTGAEKNSLDGHVNLADRSAQKVGMPVPAYEDLIDSWAGVAPVDVLTPNPFGLYHVLGNVQEWCRDPHCNQYPRTGQPGHAPGDGLLAADRDSQQRPIRGGSYLSTALLARCANRIHRPPQSSSQEAGVRPARAVVPRPRGAPATDGSSPETRGR
jgi:formylglycine-generating enzyme required for sulfatase activity